MYQQVKVSFDDESFSFWDPFKNTGFNASATILPVAEEVAKRTPGYLAYATLTTGLGLFLPPQGAIAVNIAYVAAAIARSHEDVETFCKDEGRVLLGCPSLHLALVGGALRALRFRTWRRLFVKATLFRLRYQVCMRRTLVYAQPFLVAARISPYDLDVGIGNRSQYGIGGRRVCGMHHRVPWPKLLIQSYHLGHDYFRLR